MSYTSADVSFVIPSRSNLKYLKWSYESIRKNIGDDVWICVADDNSTDGTWDWIEGRLGADSKFRALKNVSGERMGHVLLYDEIVYKLVETPLFMIAHADMYWLPNSLDNMLKHIEKQTIVSATRIEPKGLHPDGNEKILFDLGYEPEDIPHQELIEYLQTRKERDDGKTTNGVFAPWLCFTDEFKAIGGHDPLYRPTSREDDDFWNRYLLNGGKLIQSRDAYVIHLTCRGSRFNPTITTVGTNSDEWNAQNKRSERNYIRKFGAFVRHDKYHHPILSHKYDIGIGLLNATPDIIHVLEPWCNNIYYHPTDQRLVNDYIEREQVNTDYKLTEKFILNPPRDTNEIMVYVNGDTFTQSDYHLITALADIISDSGGVGEFEIGNLQVFITEMNTYENDIIVVDEDEKYKYMNCKVYL